MNAEIILNKEIYTFIRHLDDKKGNVTKNLFKKQEKYFTITFYKNDISFNNELVILKQITDYDHFPRLIDNGKTELTPELFFLVNKPLNQIQYIITTFKDSIPIMDRYSLKFSKQIIKKYNLVNQMSYILQYLHNLKIYDVITYLKFDENFLIIDDFHKASLYKDEKLKNYDINFINNYLNIINVSSRISQDYQVIEFVKINPQKQVPVGSKILHIKGNNYNLIRDLGQGAYGSVYLYELNGDQYVIKVTTDIKSALIEILVAKELSDCQDNILCIIDSDLENPRSPTAAKLSTTLGLCRSTRMPSPARFSFRAAMTPHGSFAFHTETWRT